MDEKKGFSIPPKKSLFDEGVESIEAEVTPVPDNEFIKTFANEDGTKAVNLATVETDMDGNFVAKLGFEELDDYSKGILDGEPDTRNLMVGSVFEGEEAEMDAKDEAMSLTDEFAPEDGADNEALAMAIKDAKDKVGGEPEDFSEYEDEPMLGQLEDMAPEEE